MFAELGLLPRTLSWLRCLGGLGGGPNPKGGVGEGGGGVKEKSCSLS